MKVILIDWNAYGNPYMEELFFARGYDVQKFKYDGHETASECEQAVRDLSGLISSFGPDYVFSYHYFPAVSNVCEAAGTPYVSWIYDSPAFDLYSYTVINHVNRIFVFDRGVYEEFAAGGIKTVYHLPLGVVYRGPDGKPGNGFDSDITFIGSMYTEPKHRLYDKFAALPDQVKGYLDSVMEAQKHVYGMNFLEKFITPDTEAEMQKLYPTDPNSTNAMTPAKLYAQFVLSRQVTAMERRDILTLLGKKNVNANLYTHDPSLNIPGIKNRGPVSYGNEMYRIFASSRINLNITLRSILTGIPLRALDIMSCGGFLLTNYQEELCEHFVPGEDFAYYEDYDDLCDKVDYYLSHEHERMDMASSAHEKIRREHSLSSRLDLMEATLGEN